jgi:polyhydroxyalkanoate synthesis regulator phasin
MAEKDETEAGRGLPEGLREAIEGAFAATGKTRDRAQDLTGRTRNRAQGLVEGVSKRGTEARDTLEGLRLVSRDELRVLEDRIDELSARIEELESGGSAGGPARGSAGGTHEAG